MRTSDKPGPRIHDTTRHLTIGASSRSKTGSPPTWCRGVDAMQGNSRLGQGKKTEEWLKRKECM